MLNLLKTPLQAAGALVLAAALAAAQGVTAAQPGTVNYTEGKVTLNGQSITGNELGKTAVAQGQIIATQDGRAEVLLTPGVFLRLGHDTAVKMLVASLTDTQVQLQQGKIMVSATDLEKEVHVGVLANGAMTRLDKKGLYEFTANPPRVYVYDGKAMVEDGAHTWKLGKGREVALTPTAFTKPAKFDRDQTDRLYAWSNLRSQYLAEANQSSAQMIIAGGPGWYGNGWYWNPWYDTWAFVPGWGYLNSPFGYPFYSPGYFGYAYYPPVFFGHRGFDHDRDFGQGRVVVPHGREFDRDRDEGGMTMARPQAPMGRGSREFGMPGLGGMRGRR